MGVGCGVFQALKLTHIIPAHCWFLAEIGRRSVCEILLQIEKAFFKEIEGQPRQAIRDTNHKWDEDHHHYSERLGAPLNFGEQPWPIVSHEYVQHIDAVAYFAKGNQDCVS